MLWFYSFLFVLFVNLISVCHSDMLWSKQQFWLFSPLFGHDNRVNSFIQTQRKLLRCRLEGTFCADTCWTVCSDSCFPSCAVEVKMVSSHACLQPTGVGACVVYVVSTSQFFKGFFFLKSATQQRCRRRTVLQITRLLYQSSNILCLVFTTGNAGQLLGYWVEICSTVERLYRYWSHCKLFCHHFA